MFDINVHMMISKAIKLIFLFLVRAHITKPKVTIKWGGGVCHVFVNNKAWIQIKHLKIALTFQSYP